MLYPAELRARSILIVDQPAVCNWVRIRACTLKNTCRPKGVVGLPSIVRPGLARFQLVREAVGDVVDERRY